MKVDAAIQYTITISEDERNKLLGEIEVAIQSGNLPMLERLKQLLGK